ncbi:hypothetical protein QBC46DRAFT_354795 [Diplogelasinospora grovesii]|uniref:Uncharacterized protein n=1 Tax=Diplogelasinospora grovesii TaxID=303347 RepID=A0AAN6N6V6_9PEZI|nr:hypothetical protein QBC46DRAFT_354795 [Diplogelasinospora grovesii]
MAGITSGNSKMPTPQHDRLLTPLTGVEAMWNATDNLQDWMSTTFAASMTAEIHANMKSSVLINTSEEDNDGSATQFAPFIRVQ